MLLKKFASKTNPPRTMAMDPRSWSTAGDPLRIVVSCFGGHPRSGRYLPTPMMQKWPFSKGQARRGII